MTGQDIMTSFNPYKYNQSHLMGKVLFVVGVVVVIIKRIMPYGTESQTVMSWLKYIKENLRAIKICCLIS